MVTTSKTTALTLMTRAANALEEVKSLDDIRELCTVRDKAAAVIEYGKRAELSKEIMFDASVMLLRATRMVGMCLSQLNLAKASLGNQHTGRLDRSTHDSGPDRPVTLRELQLTPNQSARAQKLAKIPDERFETFVEDCRESGRDPSMAAALRMQTQIAASDRAKGAEQSEGAVSHLRELVRAEKKFATFYADPPWPYRNRTSNGAANGHYPTLCMEEILAEPVADLAAKNAHLHLWTTVAFLREAFDVLDAWGFRYKSHYVWVKPQMGVGNYYRLGHELLVYGTKGLCEDHELLMLGTRNGEPFHEHDVRSWGEYPRTGHSEKPAAIRKLVERVSPGPYLELYGRKKVRGWTVYGNQVR